MQFTSNEVMSNDPPLRECKFVIDHHTGDYAPYSLRTVWGFFHVPQYLLYMQGLWHGAYSLLSLSQKTRKFNHLQMSL